ncbi:MAG: glycosyltransferase [Anaerolineae bacterium]
MKILHIVNTYAPVGGIETYILELLPLLRERGHENALIYRQSHPRTPDTTGQPIYHVPETLDADRDRQKVAGIIEAERPSLIYLHDVYDPELMLLASRMAPSVGYVHIVYPVCPGLAKLYRRGDLRGLRTYFLSGLSRIGQAVPAG